MGPTTRRYGIRGTCITGTFGCSSKLARATTPLCGRVVLSMSRTGVSITFA